MAEAKLKSIRRFGSRYGRTPKKMFGKIEQIQRALHKCPFCKNVKVKRESAGIWQCRKCDKKFTGKAYTLSKTKRKVDATEEKMIIEDDFDLEEEMEAQTVVPEKGQELKSEEEQEDTTESEDTESDETTESDEEDVDESAAEEAEEQSEDTEEESDELQS